jgi:DNA-binding transcriptional MerR regulator
MTVECYNINMEDKKYSIKDLCELTGFTRRTIRYYVEQGLINPPSGRGRGGFYFDTHLNLLKKIRSLQEKGYTLSSIVEFLKNGEKQEEIENEIQREVWITYEILPGFKISFSHEFEKRWGKKVIESVRLVKRIFEI